MARPWPPSTVFCVTHFIEPSGLTHLPELGEASRLNAHELVHGAAQSLRDLGFETTPEVLLRHPRRGIREYAKQWNADLIMVGSHGQTGLMRFLLGSVAGAVLRTSPCSVEIIRVTADGRPASSRPMRILAATDGSECSAVALRSLAGRPWPLNSQVKIVCASQPLVPEEHAVALSSRYPVELVEHMMRDAQEHAHLSVAEARRLLSDTDLEVLEPASTPTRDPRVHILDTAREWGADLIVMGSHGRHGMDRLLIGSVSGSVALHAKCSAEIIRAPHAIGS